MNESTPETLKELHRIREQIAKEERHLSSRERVARTRQGADALFKEWGLKLTRVSPPARMKA